MKKIWRIGLMTGFVAGSLWLGACSDDAEPAPQPTGGSSGSPAAGAGGSTAGSGGTTAGAAGTTAGAAGAGAGTGGSSGTSGQGGAGVSPVARGDYLVNHVLACSDCHTPRDAMGAPILAKAFSGIECFIDAVPGDDTQGCLSSKNLTPDATGIGNMTDDQVKDMLLNGKRPDGKFLSSVMPYYQFHNLKAADADAIVAYLRSLPPVEHVLPPHQAPFDSIPGPADPIDPATIPMPSAGYPEPEAALRGRYLAAEAGACLECHTKHNPPGPGVPIDMNKAFQGGETYPAAALGLPVPPFPAEITSRNLTPDATGLQGWTLAQIVTAIKEGKDKEGSGICPPMPSGAMAPFGGMTTEDATDIAHYLLSLPAAANEIPTNCKL